MIIYLDITDMAIGGGIHLYGKLVHYDSGKIWPDNPFEGVKLVYIIDAHQAAKFNRDEPGAFKAYRPGDKTGRFETLEHLYRVAVSEWRTHFPDGQILVVGSNSAMPRVVLDGLEPEQREHLNAIYQEGEEIGWFDYKRNWKQTNAIIDRWFDALNSYGIEKQGCARKEAAPELPQPGPSDYQT